MNDWTQGLETLDQTGQIDLEGLDGVSQMKLEYQNRQNVFNANHRRLMLEKYGYTEAMNLFVNPNNPWEISRDLAR